MIFSEIKVATPVPIGATENQVVTVSGKITSIICFPEISVSIFGN
jgi:hypothetical protein